MDYGGLGLDTTPVATTFASPRSADSTTTTPVVQASGLDLEMPNVDRSPAADDQHSFFPKEGSVETPALWTTPKKSVASLSLDSNGSTPSTSVFADDYTVKSEVNGSGGSRRKDSGSNKPPLTVITSPLPSPTLPKVPSPTTYSDRRESGAAPPLNGLGTPSRQLNGNSRHLVTPSASPSTRTNSIDPTRLASPLPGTMDDDDSSSNTSLPPASAPPIMDTRRTSKTSLESASSNTGTTGRFSFLSRKKSRRNSLSGILKSPVVGFSPLPADGVDSNGNGNGNGNGIGNGRERGNGLEVPPPPLGEIPTSSSSTVDSTVL